MFEECVNSKVKFDDHQCKRMMRKRERERKNNYTRNTSGTNRCVIKLLNEGL